MIMRDFWDRTKTGFLDQSWTAKFGVLTHKKGEIETTWWCANTISKLGMCQYLSRHPLTKQIFVNYPMLSKNRFEHEFQWHEDNWSLDKWIYMMGNVIVVNEIQLLVA